MLKKYRIPPLTTEPAPLSVPEHGLLSAILLRAILDIKTLGPKTKTIYTTTGTPVTINSSHDSYDYLTAREWLTSNSNKEFSLNWICSHLGISKLKVKKLAFDSKFMPTRVKC